VSTSRAVRIFKTYGADAIPLVSENPYRLARDITGIGFKSADLIAERLGISRTAMVRARAAIAYTLAEAMANGHCGLAEDELLVQAEKLLEIPSATLTHRTVRKRVSRISADIDRTARIIDAQLVISEIDHQLERAARENPLPRVLPSLAIVEPEVVDEIESGGPGE
jgi:ATP-dependent exoDNAse (exonuclease V) alpha subunit